MRKSLTIGSLISILLFSGIFFVSPQQTQAATSGLTCTVITYDLWPNSKDSKTQGQVSKLQNFLIAEGYLHASPTGNLGPLTESALQQFQKAQGIVSSGNYVSTGYGATGPKTRAAIKNVSCGGAASNSATSGSTAQVSLGCLAGYKFNTLTGQPCSSTAISIAQNSYTPGTSGIYISSTGGNSTTQTQTQTQTQTNPPPPVQTTDHITQYGITWTFDKPYQYGQFVNGDYWVLGPVTITSVSPGWNGITNGSMLDPTSLGFQGYDNRSPVPFNSSARLTFPATISGTKSVVSTIGLATPQTGGAESVLDTAAVLTVVSSPVSSGTFRPPYIAGPKPMWNISQVNYNLLPNLPVPSGVSVPDMSTTMTRVWLEQGSNVIDATLHPVSNMQPYNRDSAVDVSTMADIVLLNTPNQHDYANRLIQLGIDLYSDSLNNADAWHANGAFGEGNKWPILFAGIMLNDAGMKSPALTAQTAGGGTVMKFAEDGYTYYGPATSTYSHGLPNFGTDDGSCNIGSPWFQNHECRDPNGVLYPEQLINGGGYRPCCTSFTWVGEDLAARIMGAMNLWNHTAFFDYMDRWISEPENWIEYDSSPTNRPYYGYGGALQQALWNTYRNTPQGGGCAFSCSTAAQQFTLTASAGAGGAISPSGSISVTAGSTQTFNFTPSSGYQVSGVTVDGTSIGTASSYTFSNVSGNHTISVSFTQTQPSGNQSVTLSGLVAHYTFDSADMNVTSNTINDTSGNGNNGTLVNVNSGSVVPGEINQAVNLVTHTSNGVALPGISTSNNFTITGWIKWDGNFSDTGYRTIIGQDANNGLYLVIGAGVLYYTQNNTTVAASAQIPSNQWVHIAVVVNNGSLTFYINGVSSGIAGTGITGMTLNKIGYDNINESFGGSLDDFQIYNRALSGTEVSEIYNGSLSLNTSKNNSPVATPNTNNLANVLTSTLNLLPHAIPGTSYYTSLINTLSNALHSLGIK